jgi:flagellar motor switch/type III secretory pathway protein FliN
VNEARVAAFPWTRVERVERAALWARRELLSRVAGALDASRIGAALRQLLGDDIELAAVQVTATRTAARASASGAEVYCLRFRAAGVRLGIQPEAELVRAAVARLLDQDFQLGWADAGLDAALRGAGAALLLETARRAARGEAPELVAEAAPAGEWLLCGSVTLRLADKPYAVEWFVEAFGSVPAPRRNSGGLAALGQIPLRVPWVCAVSSATLSMLEGLSMGDVWIPGSQAWLAGEPALTAALLAPARSERGFPVRVSSGRTVLGPGAVAVVEERDAAMSQNESELEQVVGETPLVVRLELGALEMTASEWAALRPGDVVSSGTRLEDGVVLRTGGREIARGELVDIEGEIGVRITRVGLAKGSP